MDSPANVLITGTSTGIGRATALHLDRLGFRVFASVRKESDAEALRAEGSDRLVSILLDVADQQSILKAKEDIGELAGEAGLAGLVNNAGIAFGSPLEFAPLDNLRALFEVNVFGLLAVTQAFLPLLRQARGRIVNISSEASVIVVPFHGPYSASKLAVNGISDALRRELRPLGVQVSTLVVGSIDTPIWQKAGVVSDQIQQDWPSESEKVYGKYYAQFRRFFDELARAGVAPEAAARVVAQALTARHPKPYYLVGSDARMYSFLKAIVPERWSDWLVLKVMGIKG